MANDNTDISDIVKKCKILLLDIEGTTTSISFVKDKLFPYAEENVKDFLTNGWETDDVKEAVAALRKLALEDQENSVDGVVTIPGEDASKEDQIDGLVKSVKWQMSSDRKVGALKVLQGLIWKQGYDKGDIKGHVYDDVSPALELWRSVEDHKVYIYSSGSVQAQKLLFGQSLAGDMLKLIDGHFDTAVGAKQEAKSYAAIAESIGCKPEEILFLTDIVKEAEAARTAGVHAALVTREGNAALPADVSATFPVLHSFTQLAVSNKRKPDQDIAEDEQPAKVLKTDTDVDVKTATEAESDNKAGDNSASEKIDEVKPEVVEETEKMEIDDVIAPPESNAETKLEEVKDKVVTVVAEVTDAEVADAPECDMEPIVEETIEKTEQKETEIMETEANDAATVEEPIEMSEIKNGEHSPEETLPVITEIEDVTNDKEILNEVDDIIEGLEPIVEEPPAQDMEDLANVGQELEKECDEILTKVQDVTNLDSIPIKPLLNTIAEETMETENTDSNDVVDRILDREEELKNKESGETTVANGKVTLEQSEVELKPDVKENNEPVAKVPESAESQKSEIIAEAEKITENLSTKDESCPTEATMQQNEKDNEQSKEEIVTKNVEMESKPVTDSTNVEQNKTEEKSDVEAKQMETDQKETPTEQTSETNSAATQDNKVSDEVTPNTKEVHMNGKTNGDASVTVNGDSKDELSSRLSMENGNGVVNGANGDSNEVEQVKSESKEVEVADIKVKTVAMDEPRNDPIEQPTEA